MGNGSTSNNPEPNGNARRPETAAGPSIMVLGVGNLILKDEGFGIHVVQELERRREELGIPDTIELFDGGTLGMDLVYYIGNKDKVIIVDIINAGSRPGDIYKFRPSEINEPPFKKVSFHQVTLFDVLRMADQMECTPKDVVIIAVQPKEVNWGEELSEEVAKAIPRVIELVLEEIKKG